MPTDRINCLGRLLLFVEEPHKFIPLDRVKSPILLQWSPQRMADIVM